MEVKLCRPGQGVGWDNPNPISSYGFSLIEVLMTLSILSILAFSVFPDVSSLVARERTTILSNSLAGALAYARSESITRQVSVITCQSNDGNACHRSENWHDGFIIFSDLNANKQREDNEPLLRVYQATTNGTQLTFRGSAGIRHYLRYKPTGRAYPNGSFLVCHPENGVGNALIMTQTGRLRLSKKQTNGSTVTCD